MTARVFRLRPQSPQCQESLCLADYEQAWLRHQQTQFRRAGESDRFEKFRSRVWGNSSYADGMKIRVQGRGPMFTWTDIAANGRIEFSDMQSLMELGLVEFLVPTHRCISSRVQPQWIAYPVRNRRDFQTMVKEMQDLRPLHGEGAGNVFWPICRPEETLQGVAVSPPPALPFIPGTETEEEDEFCDGGEVDFFDEDLGLAVCEDNEVPIVSQAMKLGLSAMASASVGYGMGFVIAASIPEALDPFPEDEE